MFITSIRLAIGACFQDDPFSQWHDVLAPEPIIEALIRDKDEVSQFDKIESGAPVRPAIVGQPGENESVQHHAHLREQVARCLASRVHAVAHPREILQSYRNGRGAHPGNCRKAVNHSATSRDYDRGHMVPVSVKC
jgi:hypothetical protein